jgi:enamine deaminase RidA (YjgF/YER057c/UK114 family)
MTNRPQEKLEELGYPLGRTAPEGKLVNAVLIDGSTIYASGQVPFDGDLLRSVGKVPSQVSVADATKAAALCAANVLRVVHKSVGGVDRIARVIRVTGYVNADDTFVDAHLVINGASELLLHVFGDQGRHARTAIGVAQLPLGASVEVEMILKLKP